MVAGGSERRGSIVEIYKYFNKNSSNRVSEIEVYCIL